MMHFKSRLPVIFAALVLFAAAAFGSAGSPAAERSSAPGLVLLIVVDGLGQDQVDRNRDHFSEGGFRRFFEEGSWFSEAHFGHSATFTAVGHATLVTGAHPYRHGIVGNEWADSESGRRIYCVADPKYPVLGTDREWGVSPLRLKVPTLGDLLREQTKGGSRVYGISLKDRGAVLPAGRSGIAYFYDKTDGRFVSSTYYMEEHPGWWKKYYGWRRPQDRWYGKSWDLLRSTGVYSGSAPSGRSQHLDVYGLGKYFPHVLPGKGMSPALYYASLPNTPFGNDYLLDFVKAAVRAEDLGRNPTGDPDILIVSFSTQDYINHAYGPESLESQDALLRLDRTLSELFHFIDRNVGLDRTAVALTADHGFSESPEWLEKHGEDAGRVDVPEMIEGLNRTLSGRFGQGPYVLSWLNPTVFLNQRYIRARGLSMRDVENTAASFLRDFPGIHQVYTRDQLESGHVPETEFSDMVRRSWEKDSSGDLFLVQKPGWYLLGRPHGNASTHGSPHEYDTNVPLMFRGPWFKPGHVTTRVDMTDLAPTLAALVGVSMPETSGGRVLFEILAGLELPDRVD